MKDFNSNNLAHDIAEVITDHVPAAVPDYLDYSLSMSENQLIVKMLVSFSVTRKVGQSSKVIFDIANELKRKEL